MATKRAAKQPAKAAAKRTGKQTPAAAAKGAATRSTSRAAARPAAPRAARGANPDPLQRYRTMRDFGTTAEPAGRAVAQRAAAKTAEALSFVVQKHAARRLHYDFRLELDGTLKSWAIPKGPSLDPADKRMSVHVEDHPLEYANFEGVIPERQYGAGTVIVWDRGTWVPIGDPHQGYRDGKLKFELQGEKLHGAWTLVRMRGRDERQEPWLLIKERDDAARPAAEFDITEAMPDSVLGGGTPSADDEGARKASAKSATSTAARKAPRTAAKAATGSASGKGAAAGKSAGKTAGKGRSAAGAIQLPSAARRAALPLTLAPQLATLVQGPPVDAQNWIYELKFDGYRVLARIEGSDVKLFTRNGHDWTSKLKTLARELGTLNLPSAWLDGEIVIVDKDGSTDFQALQNAFDSERTDAIQFFVFDIPFYAGHDLRQVALVERRDLLRRLFEEHNVSAHLRFSESFEAGPEEILSAACRLRLEGLIGKRVDAPYVSARSPNWIKLKCSERQEFVIGGFTEPKGTRNGLGALLLGIHDESGRLIYAGKVGTGFDTKTLDTIRAKLDALRTDASPFDKMPAIAKGVKGIWVRPKAVAEVSFGSWTRDGLIRHAVFHGLRSDKSASAIGKEKAMPAPGKSVGEAKAAATARKGKKDKAGDKPAESARKAAHADRAESADTPPSDKPAAATKSSSGRQQIGNVRVSHADRVIDPSTGATKGDLVRYYEAVAPRMLPELRGRPLAVLRGPSGVGGELFFQKHAETFNIAGVNRLDPSLWPGHPPMIEVASETGIVAAAQLNVIEFHTWNADKRQIEKPDRVIFDLDPGAGVPWKHVVEAAALTKGMLDELELTAFLKTSGGKGLHVVVPIARRLGWDEVKDFAQALVVHMAKTIPQRFVSKSGPRNRVGKIFIDYLRNGRGATTVAAFSARARPGLGVSIPCSWDELPALRSGAQWTIANALARIEETEHADPWADYGSTRQTLTAAIRRLGNG
ncbi:ATP-dependent DNA ligase [Cupriavidus gilardii CR3]|uniref:DNA ligase (ATP) n=1 Tax=Cupriavidus gilardii TaxID=82541 RepID=A0A849BC82_9BURK|nr:DNA ligase D [Cupriavidus gilardii]ALD93632.1 ATP-dependent DNA ligase [Cupriavidus gilardii CR3]KAB0594088.1 DNA ligase D [Cupriavidus gilardii]MCT9016836.1 DNA ligase D [Cupriavidus gilardii]MCT9056483.1 DNA ligase D [Cupriavidus gilardii]NNH13490.1 DNA ligase D [Cupriavidus gilardii]